MEITFFSDHYLKVKVLVSIKKVSSIDLAVMVLRLIWGQISPKLNTFFWAQQNFEKKFVFFEQKVLSKAKILHFFQNLVL